MVTYYLYIKTHNKTGLKYLGQTRNKDPHKYLGSGTYWKNHLNKHGKDYSTEIILKTENISILSFWGLYFSREWDIILSDKWANLKEEGTGNIGIKYSLESKKKMSLSRSGRPSWNKGLPKEQQPHFGKKRSEETIEKVRQSNIGKHFGRKPRPAWNKGKKHSSEHLKNQILGITEYRKNNIDWYKNFQEGKLKSESKRLLTISKRTMVDGIEYPSATMAAKSLNIKKNTLIKRILSPNYTSYFYIT